MPKRIRTHQLEDISRNRFKSILPSEWVCRDKPDNDYGIDQEVEIFDEDGKATGLLFNVQLKATDDASKKNTVNIKIDSLQYLSSLDAPTVIVRYCDSTDTIYWIWLTNAL